jgi:hypothetical protein
LLSSSILILISIFDKLLQSRLQVFPLFFPLARNQQDPRSFSDQASYNETTDEERVLF